jgi:hypothetical protein
MQTHTSRAQERVDRIDDPTSPSAGWRTVYAEMDVSPITGNEGEPSPESNENHTLDEYIEGTSDPNDRIENEEGRRTVASG